MALGITLDSVAGSHVVPDPSGDTSTPFDRGRPAGHAHLLDSESPFLDSGRGQGASGQAQGTLGRFPSASQEERTDRAPSPPSVPPSVDPSPFWQIAEYVTDKDQPADQQSAGLAASCRRQGRMPEGHQEVSKPYAHPRRHPTRKTGSQVPLWTTWGPDHESHGAGLGKVCTWDTLMNVGRWCPTIPVPP